MITLTNENQCTGCLSCYNSCVHDAITLSENIEGFVVPRIDRNKCVGCGLCVSNCPEIKPRELKKNLNPKCYAIIDYNDVKSSSSGGAFSLLAKWILSKGGKVFGASMDQHGNVSHIMVDSINKLDTLKGSKYLQSYIGNTFKNVRQLLLSNIPVLFVGTGCQIAGLNSYLNKRYDDLLYTIDLICHGVPSNATFKSYLNKVCIERNIKNSKLRFFRFRKLDGWAITPSVQFSESKKIYLELSENAYMNAYFEGLLFRESCYNCQYCNIDRVGTFTIADFWDIGKDGKDFKKSVEHGVSLLLDNKGIFDQIKNDLKNVYIEERPLQEALKGQYNLNKPSKRPYARKFAVKDMLNSQITLTEFCKKYRLPYKRTIRWKISSNLKKILININIYNKCKAIVYKLRK